MFDSQAARELQRLTIKVSGAPPRCCEKGTLEPACPLDRLVRTHCASLLARRIVP